MKRVQKYTALLLFATAFFHACSTADTARETAPHVAPVITNISPQAAPPPAVAWQPQTNAPFTLDGLDITARGAIGWVEDILLGPMFIGNGGGNIHLAVLLPEVQGDVPDFLPLYIQGMLNNNINRFSAINLSDRQHLNRILSEQRLALSGDFADDDRIRIGHLANAQYLLFGTIQRLPGNRYSLQLSITEATTGLIRATFMRDGTLAQLEGRGTLLNEASAELLEQVGVQLTAIGRQTLLAGNISAVQAEAGLARGIIAQAGGDEVAALFNFAQAVSFDPRQLEAVTQLNTLAATISGGTISQRILNDFQLRDQWLVAFRETTRFFNDHPPFEIIFDPSLIQIGESDWARRTANLGMRIAIDHSEAGFAALNALLEGLERTGRRYAWGFSGWPLMVIPNEAGTTVLGGRRSFSYRIDVALLNERNQTIGNSSITLTTEPIGFASGDRVVTPPFSAEGIVKFPNVRVDDLTDTLTIVIVAVNGIRAHELSTSGYMRIETGHLEGSADPETFWPLFVSFSPDGRQFISGCRSGIKIWDTTTGRLTRTLSIEGWSGVTSAAFSPDGRQIFSFDRGLGPLAFLRHTTIRVWDTTTGVEVRTFELPDEVGSVAFSPDGRQAISTSSDHNIRLWEISTGRLIRTFSGHNGDGVRTVAFSPDGRQILSGGAALWSDNTVKLWDTATGRLIKTFSGHTRSVESLALSPDGRQILSGGGWGDYTVRLWDAVTGRQIRTFSGHTDAVTSVAFSPDGRQILSGSSDNTVRLWDAVTGWAIRTFSGHIEGVESVTFSPDGRQILSGSRDATVRLWDADTGRIVGTIGTETPFQWGW